MGKTVGNRYGDHAIERYLNDRRWVFHLSNLRVKIIYYSNILRVNDTFEITKTDVNWNNLS